MGRLRAFVLIILALWLLLYPAVRSLDYLRDPALASPQISRFALDLFHDLTPRFADWAEARRRDGRAAKLEPDDIAETEWPLFGAVFYLLAVQSLQAAWEQNPAAFDVEPRIYAAQAIEAATHTRSRPGDLGPALLGRRVSARGERLLPDAADANAHRLPATQR